MKVHNSVWLEFITGKKIKKPKLKKRPSRVKTYGLPW